MSTDSIEWVEADPDRVWRSLDGRYAIVANTLPENPPRTMYQARKIDPATARAYPHSGTLGYLLEESPWCWNSENSVHSAQAIIERDAFRFAHDTTVPEDYPAVALARFSQRDGWGAALAVVWKDGHLVAQVLDMVRHDDSGFVPEARTEIDLTELGLLPRDGVAPATTTDRGPEPCRSCQVKVGQPHTSDCSLATCRVTGQQRLLCTTFGGSPLAGMAAVLTGAQAEFETYIKTPVGHDCGADVWTGDE